MSEEIEKLTRISEAELTKAHENILSAPQLDFILKRTPSQHIRKRPAKGGGEWSYVTGTYVKKVLNLAFGWDWSFEVVEHKFDLDIGQAFVLGKLTCNSSGKSIVKMQFGRVDIKFRNVWENGKKTQTKIPLDIGNDLKAATTDALKKCAAELGVASDVYAPEEYKEIRVVDESDSEEELESLQALLTSKMPLMKTGEYENSQRILDRKDTSQFYKLEKHLRNLK